MAVEPDLDFGADGLPVSLAGLAGAAFDAVPDGFDGGLAEVSPDLDLAAGAALGLAGTAGSFGAFEDAAPDGPLPVGGFEAELPD